MKILIDTQKIKRQLYAIYHPNWKTRETYQDEIEQVNAQKHRVEAPTGICHGCGKNMYNGLNVCSLDCLDVIEMQLSGH